MVGLFIKSGAKPRWRHSRRAGGTNEQPRGLLTLRGRGHRSGEFLRIRPIRDGRHRQRLNKLLWMQHGRRSLGGFHDDQRHNHRRRRVHVRFDGWHSDRTERQ